MKFLMLQDLLWIAAAIYPPICKLVQNNTRDLILDIRNEITHRKLYKRHTE